MAVGLNDTAITTTVGSVMKATRASDDQRAASRRAAGRRAAPAAMSSASVSASASMAKAAAPGQLKESSPRSFTTLAIIFTLPPPSSSGVGKAESVQAKTMSPPDTMPGMDSGRVTRRKTRAGRAPRLAAARS